MNIEIDTVKGFQDFLPPESTKRKAVVKIIEKYFELYGFAPIETTIVEFDELMRPDTLPSQQEDEAVSDRFRLKDKGGRNLGLRYEFTFQLQRILKQNPNLKMPFKRYQIGPVFRDEPVSANRFRQFTQCDADIIGNPDIEADAECLALANDTLKALGIESDIEINNRKLIQALIESVKITDSKPIMRELDKLDKIGEDMVKLNLKKYADSNQILTLFKLLEKPLDFFLDNAFDGSADLDNLIKKCKLYGFTPKLNPFLMRGLSYYTSSVFEIKVKDSKDSIGGGGRYDKSVGRYLNKEIPAVGISFGLERLCSLAKIKIEQTPKAILISFNQDKETIKLAQVLRKA